MAVVEIDKMARWIAEHQNDARVLDWLKRNPPPIEWRGTAMEYTYTEMPGWIGSKYIGG